MRSRFLLVIVLLVPLGIATKFYTGPAEKWVWAHAGGFLYVVFWCVLVSTLRSSFSPWIVAGAVLAITSILEFLQLWHPAFLEVIRSTWVGHALIGTSFSWFDFPYYVAGALVAVPVVRFCRNSHRRSGEAAT